MATLTISGRPQEPSQEILQPIFSSALTKSLRSGAITALAAVIFTPIPALGGAIFGATSHFSGFLVNVLLDKVGCNPDSPLGRILKWVVSFFASIGIAATVTTLLGIPITFTGGLILTGAALLTSCLAICVFAGAVLIMTSCLAICVFAGAVLIIRKASAF